MRLVKKIEEELGINGIETGIDVVGSIAIVKFPKVHEEKKFEIAKKLIEKMNSVKTVFEQEGPIEGEYRIRKIRFIAGIKTTLTLHKENGIKLMVDVSRCYFSPRLATERLRVANLCKEEERVLNMFAGVGPFSILIANRAKSKVTSCDINYEACRLHVENCKINKVSRLVEVINSDSRIIPELIREKYDRILMPLPSHSNLFLPKAISMLKEGGRIHYYRHAGGRDKVEAEKNLEEELLKLAPNCNWKIRSVREIGPMFHELVADISFS